jgi:Predicted glycosyltransferases
MISISIIIPVHNRKLLTQNILNQLHQQVLGIDVAQITIVVVDDGSIDGTSELIRHEFAQVHLLRGDGSLWWGGAIKLGMEYSINHLNTDYILWLNDDIVLADNFINNLANLCHLNSNQETIIGGLVRNKNEPNWLVYSGHVNNTPLRDINFFNDREEILVDLICGNIVLIPRKVVNTIGFPDATWLPQNGCDYEYILRARQAGFRIVVNSQLQGFNDFKLSDLIRYMPYWMQWYLQKDWSKRWQILKGFTNIKTNHNIWVVLRMHSQFRHTRNIASWHYILAYLNRVLRLLILDWLPQDYVYQRTLNYLKQENLPQPIIQKILELRFSGGQLDISE